MDRTAIYTGFLVLAILMLAPFIVELLRMRMTSKPSIFDIIRARQLKEPLRQMLLKSRLSRMLGFVGIQMDDYVIGVSEGEIKTHIARCDACTDTAACDRCLQGKDADCDMKFCPNLPSLQACKRLESVNGQAPESPAYL